MPSTSRTTTLKKTRTPSPRPRVRKATAIPPVALSHEQIAARAYDLFERSGHQHGRDMEFWLEAERSLKDGVKV